MNQSDPSTTATLANPSKCTAHTSKGPCKNWPVKGATVCRMHGGSAPQVRAKAAQRVAEAEVRAAFVRLDVPPVDNPLAEMARITGQVVAWKDRLADRINELTSLSYDGGFGEEKLRAEVALFERGLDRCERFLTAMARMNIDDRLTAIHEQQARVLIGAFERVLETLELSEEQRALVAPALRAQFELIAGGEAA